MILHIDTTQGQDIEIAIKNGKDIMISKKISALYSQAEKLLPMIDKLLQKNKLKLKNITEIEVNNKGGSFTALRIGVVTANALGFALGIPVKAVEEYQKKKKNQKFDIIKPEYAGEPNITIKKNKIN